MQKSDRVDMYFVEGQPPMTGYVVDVLHNGTVSIQFSNGKQSRVLNDIPIAWAQPLGLRHWRITLPGAKTEAETMH